MGSILTQIPVRLCLTTEYRTDRHQLVGGEFRSQRLNVKEFYAVPGVDAKDSFNKSFLAMVQKAITGKIDAGGALFFGNEHPLDMQVPYCPVEYALFFEDDVTFKSASHLVYAFNELPEDFDMLYLGGNLTNGDPEYFSEHLCKVRHVWTTHAVIMKRTVMEFISDHYIPRVDGMFDDWLARRVHPYFNCFCVNPMVCWQRPSRSDLWNVEADYTECFMKSDDLMQQAKWRAGKI